MRRALLFLSVIAITPTFANAGTFLELGTHPYARLQSTGAGRALSTLYGFNNKIYAGYGDYNANTGPIAIHPYDLASQQFTPAPLLWANTEAIYIYREINGRLYAPHIDPRSPAVGSYAYAVTNGTTDVWTDAPPITAGTAIHIFDIASYGGALYLASTDDTAAAIYKSIDNGTTWTLDHRVPPTKSGDFMRFYGLVDFKNKLWAQADSYLGPLATQSEVFNGTSWTSGNPMLGANTSHAVICQPEVFGQDVIFLCGHPGFSAVLFSFSGTSTSWIRPGGSSTICDFKVDGSTLWVLLPNGQIYTAEHLNRWTYFDTAPSTARSLVHYHGNLYVGTSDSRLLVYTPAEPAPGFALTDATRTGDGGFQFSFTNTPGLLFGVLTTTNAALPLTNWTVLGRASENAPGYYSFTDSPTNDTPQRFYRVRSL